MRRAAANLLHRVVADGIGPTGSVARCVRPILPRRCRGLAALGHTAARPDRRRQPPDRCRRTPPRPAGRRAIRQRDMGKPGIAGTRDKFDLHRRARIGHHRRAAGDNLHMVVQTLRIEIQPVSGKGIEVRDDRKTLAVNRLSRRLATRAPTAPGASTMAKVSPQFGGVAVMPP